MSPEQRDAERIRQFRSFLVSLGVQCNDAKADDLVSLFSQEMEGEISDACGSRTMFLRS
jgi:hypothetical protein